MKEKYFFIHIIIPIFVFWLTNSLLQAQTDTISGTDSSYVFQTNSGYDTSYKNTDSTLVLYYIGTTDSLRQYKLHSIDTTITSFHNYDPVTDNYGMYATLSNIGTAHKNRVFAPYLQKGFLMHNTVYEKYMYRNEKVKYYNPVKPFTELWYVMGPKKEQNLKVTFTREIYKGFIFGMDIMMYNSPGAYQNNKSDDKSIYLTGQYFTKNKRYGIIANYLHNKLILNENGGIKYDSVFENNLETDRRVVPVNLTTAQNMVKEAGFFIEQYFNLLKPEHKTDSTNRKIDAGHISYAIQYQRNLMIYNDNQPVSEFYNGFAPPLDSAKTYDSTYQMLFRNRFKWSSLGYNDDKLSKVFNIYFGADYDHIELTLPYDSVKNIYNQLSPFGGININILKSAFLEAKGNIVFGGYNSGDFSLKGKLTQYLGTRYRNAGKLKLGLEISSRTPAWYFSEYQSNRFRWNLNLKKENFLIIDGSYSIKGVEAGLHLYTISNYTFLNDTVFPEQIENAETVMQIFAKGMITVRKFGFDGKLVYQTTSRPNIIKLPAFTGTLNLFYKTPAFHNAALFQGGLQLTYFTNYYADAYMPELRLFYNQNGKQIGNYLYADAYLTLKIKRARLFFKARNFTGYFEGYRYFSSPHYPAMDPGFYFGVSWKFFD